MPLWRSVPPCKRGRRRRGGAGKRSWAGAGSRGNRPGVPEACPRPKACDVLRGSQRQGWSGGEECDR
eukprot:9477324-Pyramimonas_sp.AAC.1